ncbi:MAG: hypothetical protein ACTSU5_10275 [Promethearchaeota archaeon]
MGEDYKKMLLKLEDIADLLKEIRDLLKGGAGPAAAPEGTRKPSDVKYEQDQKKSEASVGGRLQCPKCGSTSLTEHVNKDKVLMYQGGQPIYAKKYVCNKCGTVVE